MTEVLAKLQCHHIVLYKCIKSTHTLETSTMLYVNYISVQKRSVSLLILFRKEKQWCDIPIPYHKYGIHMSNGIITLKKCLQGLSGDPVAKNPCFHAGCPGLMPDQKLDPICHN